MKTNVLVAYVSEYSSTQEVADVVATMLRDGGMEVDLRPARKVRSVDGYRAIVLGAPIYLGAWHNEAVRFLDQHQEDLQTRPVAVFALGPIHDPTEKDWAESRAAVQRGLAKSPWLTPIALGVFGGKFDPTRLHLRDRMITSLPASPLHNVPASDLRDWTAIRAWAGDVAGLLQAAST